MLIFLQIFKINFLNLFLYEFVKNHCNIQYFYLDLIYNSFIKFNHYFQGKFHQDNHSTHQGSVHPKQDAFQVLLQFPLFDFQEPALNNLADVSGAPCASLHIHNNCHATCI
jgi:hypothetical protein